ncbi:hypothetical protein [Streptosporangium sp. NPDC048865]|uniref:hypothetical protein n=1 Tax=Streptosporangium sp. NPDC048865 TaxID=3155766 RepID=UPI00343C7E69
MSERTIEPNAYSPHATADPAYRHLLPSLTVFGRPIPGKLTLTGCQRLAVVPEGTLGDLTDALRTGNLAALPAGFCPVCLQVATGRGVAKRPAPQRCQECGSGSSQGEVCALCRQSLHDDWWPTREASATSAQDGSRS